MGDLQLVEAFEARIVPVGKMDEPVIVIDRVMQDWRKLRDMATLVDWRDVGKTGGFPGLRAPLPADYVKPLLNRLDPMIREMFFKGEKRKLGSFDCAFSLVTYEPGTLDPRQTIPHVDVADRNRVAVLHYLCPEQFGGTAFYRQLSTGLEQVDLPDRARWLAGRREELETASGDDFPSDTTPGYTRTASFEIRPDRMLVYRSHNLHSGIIDRPDLLSTDPLEGRLTANFFLQYVPLETH